MSSCVSMGAAGLLLSVVFCVPLGPILTPLFKRCKMTKHLPTIEQQREAQALKDKAIRAWASDRGVGTQPPTFPEVSRAPKKSRKNIKRPA